jgi:hypothetical protein
LQKLAKDKYTILHEEMKYKCWHRFMLACILPNNGEFRPRFYLDLTNKNPKALTYQSLAKAEEGLTGDTMRIT